MEGESASKRTVKLSGGGLLESDEESMQEDNSERKTEALDDHQQTSLMDVEGADKNLPAVRNLGITEGDAKDEGMEDGSENEEEDDERKFAAKELSDDETRQNKDKDLDEDSFKPDDSESSDDMSSNNDESANSESSDDSDDEGMSSYEKWVPLLYFIVMPFNPRLNLIIVIPATLGFVYSE